MSLDKLRKHEATCSRCETYPKTILSCPERQKITTDEIVAAERAILILMGKSEGFLAGAEWAARKAQAFRDVMQPLPACNFVLHATPAYRPQDGCIHCGYKESR